MTSRIAIFLKALLTVPFWVGILTISPLTGAYADDRTLPSGFETANLKRGVLAYREGDYAASWRLLKPIAANGHAKAQRYLGYILLDGDAPSVKSDLFEGVALLKKAALDGDYTALIRLEQLRKQALAHSPSMADLIDVEIARAENGDPVTAWRLAQRYETGDGVVASFADHVKWLTVAASVDAKRFPKSAEASFRLCEIYALDQQARDPKAAREWCAAAVDQGHAGAAIVLRRLAQLPG